MAGSPTNLGKEMNSSSELLTGTNPSDTRFQALAPRVVQGTLLLLQAPSVAVGSGCPGTHGCLLKGWFRKPGGEQPCRSRKTLDLAGQFPGGQSGAQPHSLSASPPHTATSQRHFGLQKEGGPCIQEEAPALFGCKAVHTHILKTGAS